MDKKWKGVIAITVIVVLIFAVGIELEKRVGKILGEIHIGQLAVPTPTPERVKQIDRTTRVKRAIDGDTIETEDGVVIRYIGIDTPETKDPRKGVECFGQEAYERNKELVEGKEIGLEKDTSETDRYGRLLRYVWIGSELINERLAREGMAQALTYPPDVKYSERILEAQNNAKVNKQGLWEKCK